MGAMPSSRTKTKPRPTRTPLLRIEQNYPVQDLVDFPGNARVHDNDLLDESIADHGQHRALLARQLPDGRLQLLSGHGTRDALARAGITHVDVEVRDVPDTALARRVLLIENSSNDRATYDQPGLLALLDAAKADGGLHATGFDEDLYAELLDAVEDVAGKLDDETLGSADSIDASPAKHPISRPGDVWVLGRHRLICGDSRNPEVWQALMGKDRAACVWTDPPYGVAIVGVSHALPPEERLKRGGKVIANDDLDEDGLRDLLDGALGQALAWCEPGAAWWVAAPPGPLNLVFGAWLHHHGLYRQQLIWVKDRFVMGRSDYHYRHEPIFYGWKPGAGHRRMRDRTQDTVWEIPRPQQSKDHPTMKPVQLVTRALLNSTRRGDIVAEPFSGSGTTLLACEMTDRVGRAVELDPGYADAGARRWQELTGALPVNERLGEPVDLVARAEG